MVLGGVVKHQLKRTAIISHTKIPQIVMLLLSQYLLVIFDGVSKNQIDNIECCEISETFSKGYVLEVDLELPKYFHDLHSDEHFSPENFISLNDRTPKV